MVDIETDYLVIGAGATGMAFVDTLVTARDDVDVVLVDRRHRPGGHWLDAYPFVRLHQPSAYYGVDSLPLGHDRIDTTGPNAGFYERASAAEIVDYFGRVLDEVLLPTGRVRFLGMHDVTAGDGVHRAVSALTGEETTIRVRGKVVDATYIQSEIPSRHTPSFTVDDGVRLVSPNALVDLTDPADRFTIIGAGKTAMDTCNWLLDAGVDPDRIRWVRTRDPWLFDRTFMQPLDLVASYMELQGSWVEAAARAEDARDFAHRLEADGVLVRIDPEVEPGIFRGATISQRELASLRAIENVVRSGRVSALGSGGMVTATGELASGPKEVYVDCSAAGLPRVAKQPVFAPGRITMQYVTIGIAPWSAATIAAVEASGEDDAPRNSMCPPGPFSGNAADAVAIAYAGMTGLVARSGDRSVSTWNDRSRLNPSQAASAHAGEPRVGAAYARMGEHIGAALENLGRLVGA